MSDLLAHRADDCTRCSLSVTRQRVVVGSGPSAARLLVLGEAPGATEDAGGEPFIGRSGQLLFRLLGEETGLRREDCYVTNVVKCRPPGNRTPTRVEIAACRGWLDEQLAQLRAPVAVTLGNTATTALLGPVGGINSVRGVARTLGPLTVVPMLHPAAVLRGGNNLTDVMRADLRVVASLLGTNP